MRHIIPMILFMTLSLTTNGCSTDIAMTSVPAQLQPLVGSNYRLAQSVSVDLPPGYSADDLKAKTSWQEIGSISQGRVFRSVKGPMQVKAGPYFECDLVVKENILVGIYLPTKSAFVHTDPPAVILWDAK